MLNEITDVDKLEKGNERGNMVVRGCGARIVGGEVLDGFVKASFDMAGAEDLEECYKDGFALFFSARKNSSVFPAKTIEVGGALRFFSCLPPAPSKQSCSLQTLFRIMYQTQCDFQTKQTADPLQP